MLTKQGGQRVQDFSLQGGHCPGNQGKIRESEKRLKSQGKVREFEKKRAKSGKSQGM